MSMYVETTNLAGDKTFLRTPKFQARPYTITSASVTADANGKKIVPAGTPLPANGATVKGLLLKETDVTDGDKPAALVYVGSVSTSKLTALGVTVAAEAKAALPRITFFD